MKTFTPEGSTSVFRMRKVALAVLKGWGLRGGPGLATGGLLSPLPSQIPPDCMLLGFWTASLLFGSPAVH